MSNVYEFSGLVKRVVTGKGAGGETAFSKDKTQEQRANEYTKFFKQEEAGIQERQKNYDTIVDSFYDLVTDFYEKGWCASFHFATRAPGETFMESIIRHEHYIAASIDIRKGERVADLGCGIGGPMRNIAKFTHARITGVTINEYQVRRGMQLTKQQGLDKLCNMVVGDYFHLDFPDNSFDKAFSIEATVHAGENRVGVFKEALRILKPGGLFATYEWALTDKHDPNNARHRETKFLIEEGNGLPNLITTHECRAALEKSGFEVLEAFDLDLVGQRNGSTIPWYWSMEGRCSFETFQHTAVGVWAAHAVCWLSETLGLAPKGTVDAHNVLRKAHKGLVRGGQDGTITPMYLMIGRKPLKK